MDFKLPVREQNSNKGTFGKVLNVAGSENYIGAAYLSSFAALKIGSGYVALASGKNIIDSVSKLLPEAVFISRNEGLKHIRWDNKGNLYVTVKVVVPKKLSEKQKDILEEFAKESGEEISQIKQ